MGERLGVVEVDTVGSWVEGAVGKGEAVDWRVGKEEAEGVPVTRLEGVPPPPGGRSESVGVVEKH